MRDLNPPRSLVIYEILASRKQLTPKEKQRYNQLKKGFIGERTLENILKKNNYHNIIPLFDCRFLVDGREVQIDCLLISSHQIFLLEIKNYTDDYHLDNNKLFYLPTQLELYNPFNQLERSEYLLKRLLDKLGIKLAVHSYIYFVNPNFILYGATPQLPLIFSPQIYSFLRRINENSNPISEKERLIVRRLLQQIKENTVHEDRPVFKFEDLRKGIYCVNCRTQLQGGGRTYLNCSNCKKRITMEEAVLVAIAQFHFLFPNKKIRTKTMLQWSAGLCSRTFMKKLLNNHLRSVENGAYTYYEFKSDSDFYRILLKNTDLLYPPLKL